MSTMLYHNQILLGLLSTAFQTFNSIFTLAFPLVKICTVTKVLNEFLVYRAAATS